MRTTVIGRRELAIAFALIFPFSLSGLIQEIHSLQEIRPFLENGDENSLAIFDIDDTLTILEEPAFQKQNCGGYHKALFRNIRLSLNSEERELCFHIPIVICPSQLIEDDTPTLIKELQQKNIRTLALTAAPAGLIGGVYVEDRRIEELKNHGIDFSCSFPKVSNLFFSNLESKNGLYPLYKEGMILTNRQNKGIALVEFFEHCEGCPQVVVFVDDRMYNLKDVESSLKAYSPSTLFIGLYYTRDMESLIRIEPKEFEEKWLEVVDLAKFYLLLEKTFQSKDKNRGL